MTGKINIVNQVPFRPSMAVAKSIIYTVWHACVQENLDGNIFGAKYQVRKSSKIRNTKWNRIWKTWEKNLKSNRIRYVKIVRSHREGTDLTFLSHATKRKNEMMFVRRERQKFAYVYIRKLVPLYNINSSYNVSLCFVLVFTKFIEFIGLQKIHL